RRPAFPSSLLRALGPPRDADHLERDPGARRLRLRAPARDRRAVGAADPDPRGELHAAAQRARPPGAAPGRPRSRRPDRLGGSARRGARARDRPQARRPARDPRLRSRERRSGAGPGRSPDALDAAARRAARRAAAARCRARLRDRSRAPQHGGAPARPHVGPRPRGEPRPRPVAAPPGPLGRLDALRHDEPGGICGTGARARRHLPARRHPRGIGGPGGADPRAAPAATVLAGAQRRATSAAIRPPRAWARWKSSSETRKRTGRPSTVLSGKKTTNIPAHPGNMAGEPWLNPHGLLSIVATWPGGVLATCCRMAASLAMVSARCASPWSVRKGLSRGAGLPA